ncbi:unnamed protein product [Pelagomonas calceolata]|uniref:HTH myb-type domain-containing protein n=1 Tax=Pelagomonas calceolata TaxID=35677 RepID=A0A8J2T161_9STRA|nr:unnamed protein product [Pelagomonas calceolata]
MAKKAAEKDTEEETEKPAAAPAPGYASLPVAYAASLQQHYAQHASQSTQQTPGDANARAYQSYQVAQYNAALAAAAPPRPKPKGKDANNPHQRHGRWTEEEHTQFLSLMTKYGRSWTKISQCMRTRSEPQVRSHAQKHFLRLNRLEKAAKGEGAAPAEAQYPKPERKKQKRRKVETPAYEQPSSDEAGVPSALLAQGVALPGPPQQPYYGQGGYPYPYMVPPQPGAAQQPYYNYLPFAAMPNDPNAAAAAAAPAADDARGAAAALRDGPPGLPDARPRAAGRRAGAAAGGGPQQQLLVRPGDGPDRLLDGADGAHRPRHAPARRAAGQGRGGRGRRELRSTKLFCHTLLAFMDSAKSSSAYLKGGSR